MKCFGEQRLITLKSKDPATGKVTPVLMPTGEVEKKLVKDRVARVTRHILGHGFGKDSTRRLVVRLVDPDQIEFKIYKSPRAIRCNVRDLYRYAVNCYAQAELSRNARESKAQRAAKRLRLKLESAARKLAAS